MGMMVTAFFVLALLAIGGGGTVFLLVHLGKLEWVAPQSVVDEAYTSGFEDRKNHRPFSPPAAALVSSATMSAYHRGYDIEAHRLEMQRMKNNVDEWRSEVDGSKREAIRTLRELHLFPLPTNLDEAPLGRAVYLLARELRAARVALWSVDGDGVEEEFGPMSQRGVASSNENHTSVH